MLSAMNAKAQKKDYPKGKAFGTIFFNFHSEINNPVNQSEMEINRVYFGYKYDYNKFYRAYVKFDIADPVDFTDTSLVRRHIYVKNAGFRYMKDKLTFNVGIIDIFMFTVQEKYWGHRYINKSFLDRFKFGNKADIGTNISWQFNKRLSVDFGIYNGEGYKKIQFDNTYKAGLGITAYPFKKLVIRLYGDYSKKTIAEYSGAVFLGYKYKDKAVIGAEYNYLGNHGFELNHNQFGYSVFGTVNLGSKWQYFARYDCLNSNTLQGEQSPWHIHKDGNAVTTGFQYQIIKGIKVSVNYQDWIKHEQGSDDLRYLFFNLEVKF